MIATIYGRGQMVIPAKARHEAGIQKGDVVSVRAEGPGKLVLERMQVPEPPKYKIAKKGGYSVGVGGRKITHAEIKQLEESLL